jgi:protein-L-isoaspartate(D-aspartate) O-methyltransferase
MAHVEFPMLAHKSTRRDYRQRVLEHDKAECAEVAIQFGQDYWDGDRKHGYGGYRYDGRQQSLAEALVRHYGLQPGASILDVGCGKGYLLYEFTRLLPGAHVAGIDLSTYAIEHAKEEIKPFVQTGNAVALPYPNSSFDFVVSVTTLHNLYNYELFAALKEIERVGRGPKHIIIETYRNEREKVNLLYWQLTCRCFYTPAEWEWIFQQAGYAGDYSYIVFE